MSERERKTQILRCMLTQEVRVFLAPAAFWRRVQIVLPAEPRFFIAADLDVRSDVGPGLPKPDTADGPGANRIYKLPPMDGDQQISFTLAPGQWLCGATERGAHAVAVIAEWMAEP